MHSSGSEGIGMHEIEKWLRDAARENGVMLRKLSEEEAKLVEATAHDRFVRGSPRVWWLGLEGNCESYNSASVKLSNVIPDTSGTCWLLPETDETNLPVYEVDVSQVPKLIQDSPFFEYNLVAKDFRWLIAESEHDVYFLCRGKAERS